MPYTHATILEAHRRAQIIPIAIAHKVVSDFEYRGYLFKEVSVSAVNGEMEVLDVQHTNENIFRFVCSDWKIIQIPIACHRERQYSPIPTLF